MGDRITAVHVKDIAPAGENADEDGWADVGQGTVDWKGLMAALKEQTKAKYFVMEHDNPKDDKRFADALARRGREALRRQHMTRTLGIGIIGCGNISAAYFRLAPLFKGLEVRACADINMAAAEARAKEFGVRAEDIDALLADPDVDVVINLTIPDAHYGVTLDGARGRQARLFREALRPHHRRGQAAEGDRRRARACASARRPTPSSAARTSWRASSSTTARSAPSPPAPPT